MTKEKKQIAKMTIFLFLLATVVNSYPLLLAQQMQESDETSLLLKEADEAYQNGNFKLAIEKYQKIMRLINDKKELALTKQQLFQTMASLALTYFTIQENAKAETQLQDLIQINPNQELDPEFYPPRFMEIFRTVQSNLLGKLIVASTPAGALVTIGMNQAGRTPLLMEKMLKGKYVLAVELKGYAPVSKEISIQAATENRENFQLEAVRPIIEKQAQPDPTKEIKKKKKISPLLLIGGGLAVILTVVVLAGKKSEPAKQLQSLVFSEENPVPIDLILPSSVLLNVSGVPAKIEKIDYKAVIEHPQHMEDLTVTIVATDTRTLYNIWNRGQSTAIPTVIGGSSNDFNNVPANGVWRLLVQNPGRHAGGRILGFTLKIYFFQ